MQEIMLPSGVRQATLYTPCCWRVRVNAPTTVAAVQLASYIEQHVEEMLVVEKENYHLLLTVSANNSVHAAALVTRAVGLGLGYYDEGKPGD